MRYIFEGINFMQIRSLKFRITIYVLFRRFSIYGKNDG